MEKRKLLSGLIISGLVLAMMAITPTLTAAARITAMSHTHPEGENFSYVCAKVKGRPGTRYVAKAEGPAVLDGTVRFKMGQSGVRKVTFEIEAAGDYTVKVRRASRDRVLAKDTYSVPPPPPDGAAQGPFDCR